MATRKIIDEGKRPNIKLREGAEPLNDGGEIHAGMRKPMLLPSAADQAKGWYAPDAAEIIRFYPDRYIPFVDKGGNS
jgi:hypothetical protein